MFCEWQGLPLCIVRIKNISHPVCSILSFWLALPPPLATYTYMHALIQTQLKIQIALSTDLEISLGGSLLWYYALQPLALLISLDSKIYLLISYKTARSYPVISPCNVSWNSFQLANWGCWRVTSFFSYLSGITVLYCYISNSLKTIFSYNFFPVFKLLQAWDLIELC